MVAGCCWYSAAVYNSISSFLFPLYYRYLSGRGTRGQRLNWQADKAATRQSRCFALLPNLDGVRNTVPKDTDKSDISFRLLLLVFIMREQVVDKETVVVRIHAWSSLKNSTRGQRMLSTDRRLTSHRRIWLEFEEMPCCSDRCSSYPRMRECEGVTEQKDALWLMWTIAMVVIRSWNASFS